MNTYKQTLIAVACLIAVTAFPFLGVLNHGFTNHDDDIMVTDNPYIRTLSFDNLSTVFLSSYSGLYHPLVTLSYAVEYRFAGLNPRVFHATNLVLHVLNTVLVFFLVLALGQRFPTALFAALLFGIHPLRVESVAWITERKDLLYSLFFLAGLLAYAKYQDNRRAPETAPAWFPARYAYASAILLYLLSLLSKPMAISFPLVLFLMDYLKGRAFTRAVIAEKLPFIALAGAFGILALRVHYLQGTGVVATATPLLLRAGFASFGTMFYLVKLTVPYKLSAIYPWSLNAGYYNPVVLALSGAALAAIIGAVVVMVRRNRLKTVSFGLLFFLATLLPVMQLVPIGSGLFADRYTYIPALGIFLIAAAAVSRALEFARDRAPLRMGISFALAALLSAFTVITRDRTTVWNNSLSLWNDAAAKYPDAAIIYKARADAFRQTGQDERAAADYDRAIRLFPRYAQAYNNRGNMYDDRGSHDRALADYSMAIKLNPGYVPAWYNRAVARAKTGDLRGAIDDYTMVIQLNPLYAEAWNNRGAVYARSGRIEQAIRDFKEALRLNPDLEPGRKNLNRALSSQ